MRTYGRHILRWHASFVMILTPILTIGAYADLFTGAGPHGGLAKNPMAVAGPAPQRFSLLAIAAHRVLLSAQAMFWGPIMVSSIAPAIPLSFLIHGGVIAAELLSLRRGYV